MKNWFGTWKGVRIDLAEKLPTQWTLTQMIADRGLIIVINLIFSFVML